MPPSEGPAPGPAPHEPASSTYDFDVSGVSVLVVNWNAGPLLRRCAKAAIGAADEVIVLDNASTDGSADDVAARVPGVRLVREAVNRGFAGGVNRAARLAHGRWLLVLNPDAVATREAVHRLRECLLTRADAGAVGACLVDDIGAPQRGFTLRRFPTLSALASDLLLIDDLWPGNPARLRYLATDLPVDGDLPFEADQPAAACLMVRRDAFEQISGFDETFYPAWFDDVDFCRRLRDAGWTILFEPRARVPHVGGSSVTALGRAGFARAYYRNMRRYVARHHGPWAARLLWGLQAVGMTMRALLAMAMADRDRLRASLAVLRDLVMRPSLSPP